MLSYEETELLFDRYLKVIDEINNTIDIPLFDFEKDALAKEMVRRRKNVDSQKAELGQGNGTEISQGKSEVFHEVQD